MTAQTVMLQLQKQMPPLVLYYCINIWFRNYYYNTKCHHWMYSTSPLIHSAKLWHKKHSSHFSHPAQTVQHCQTVHSATVLQF